MYNILKENILLDSDFLSQYKNIIQIIQDDLDILNKYFETNLFLSENQGRQIVPILKEFFSCNGKRIRASLIFLLTKSLGRNTDEFYYKLALSNEIIHNATLIHDDIIDCSILRRGRNTLNFDYDSKLAVLAGDYLLSVVLKLLAKVDDSAIRELHSEAVSKIITGELEQYFNRFKLFSIDDYIEKSKNKTARLFETGLVSCYLYENQAPVHCENIRNFALNFGIAFQIDNDLKNFADEEKMNEDITNGDYSAPLIYYAEEKKISEIRNSKHVLKDIKNTKAIDKTKALKNYYINLAIENICFLEDNQYTRAIKNLCRLYTG